MLTSVLPLKPGVGQNIATRALSTAMNFFLVLISTFPVHSPSFFFSLQILSNFFLSLPPPPPPPPPFFLFFFLFLFTLRLFWLMQVPVWEPPKGGRGCLMFPSCLESQGYHLIPLSYLVFFCLVLLLFLSCLFLLMVHSPDFLPENSQIFFVKG